MSNVDLYDFDGYVEPGDDNVNTKEITDLFDRPPAFKVGFIGVGQCGNNLATAFHRVGYRRVLLLNTATADLNAIEDQIAKLAIDSAGAGKDPHIGKSRVMDKITTIRSNILRELADFEKIVVCMGLGGGTGSGGGPEIVKIAQDIVKSRGGDPQKDVIVIETLPNPQVDGPRQCFNALEAYAAIDALKVPTICVDNVLVGRAIQTTYKDIWGPVNMWIARTFHAFNNFANQESQQGVLDARDLNDVISRGRITFSACGIKDIGDKYSVSERIVGNLTKSLFAAANLRSAEAAGCVVLINQSFADRLSSADLEPAFEELNNLMRKHSTLHRGIYVRDLASAKGSGPAMFWYVMLSGIDHPWETLETLFNKAKAFSQEYANVKAFFEAD
jgi:hypothetical protein